MVRRRRARGRRSQTLVAVCGRTSNQAVIPDALGSVFRVENVARENVLSHQAGRV